MYALCFGANVWKAAIHTLYHKRPSALPAPFTFSISVWPKIFLFFSPMSYNRQSLESRDGRVNGCLGPSRTSCVLTTALERAGNRCSTNQTSIRRHEDSARKIDLLQLASFEFAPQSNLVFMRSYIVRRSFHRQSVTLLDCVVSF